MGVDKSHKLGTMSNQMSAFGDTEAFLAHLHLLDVRLTVVNGNLTCTAPRGVLTPPLQQEIKLRKPEISELLGKRRPPGEQPGNSGGRSERNPPTTGCIHDWFEQQAARTPEAVAVISGAEQLTYRELSLQSNRLANRLRAMGIGPEVLTGICLDRSIGMVTALFAVLKAGGAYLPLDPQFPRERLAFMLEDSGARVVVTEERLLELLPRNIPSVVCMDRDRHLMDGASAEPPVVATRAENLAYVIYTSGSTGMPKGVEIEHRAVVNFLASMREEPGISDRDRLLAVTTLSFDIAGLEIYLPLIAGAQLTIAPRAAVADGSALARLLRESGATLMQATPATWRLLLDSGWRDAQGLKMLCGGEAMPRELANRLLATGGELWNLYGPTETTIWSTIHRVDSRPGAVPVGRPIANTGVYVLDDRRHAVPPGVVGELYIGGDGLARGYLKRPEATTERFVADPFRPGNRLYRTGDLVRRLSDGNLEYVGRQDQQIKLRGFRIELGEIEAALEQQPGIRQAVVQVRQDESGDQRLAAYLVSSSPVPATSLRQALASKLPEYMVPSTFDFLDAFPLTPNKKVDRKALPAPAGQAETLPQTAGTDTENKLIEIWRNLLGVPDVGLRDDFFALGGHSLLIIRLQSSIRREFSRELPIAALFAQPTVAQIAELLDGSTAASLPAGNAGRQASDAGSINVVPIKRTPREKALSSGQQRLWYLDQSEPQSGAHNLAVFLRLEGVLDREALQRSLREIVRRHEILRTALLPVDGAPETRVMPADDWDLAFSDLRAQAGSDSSLTTILESELRRPFDLAAGSMIRATLMQTGDLEAILTLVIHHIAMDGWSFGVLGRELTALYSAYHAGVSPQLPELQIQYSDYSAWQREWLESGVLAAELPYWKERLQGAGMVELPSNRPRPAVTTYRGRRIRHELSPEAFAAVRNVTRNEGVTLYMALLSAFYLLLNRYTGQTDVTVGGVVAGRDRPEFENLIGLFINSLALRTNLAGDPTVRELLGRAKETTLDALAHQHVPFDQLVAALQPHREFNRAPFFGLMFNLQNMPQASLDLPGLNIYPVEMDKTTAGYDLTVEAYETGKSIRLDLEYSTDLYDETTVRGFVAHFERLLVEMTLDPGRRVSELRLLSEAETAGLLAEGQGRTLSYRQDRCVGAWIEEKCLATPGAIAVICEERRISYREVSKRSNRLARRLRELGITRGALVGVCLERSEQMVIAVLAIWKAGAAYVPLDPLYPPDRLAFMAEDAAIAVLVTEENLRHTVTLASTVQTLLVDADSDSTRVAAPEDAPRFATADDLAYVIFTSGSTGTPKGVQITHRALTNLLTSMLQEPGMVASDCLLSVTSLSFDIAGLELYLPLLAGGRIVVATREVATDGRRLAELIARSGATVMQATPATWRLLLEAGWGGNAGLKMICGGEAFPPDLAKRLLSAGAGLWNAYGPTETTIWSTLQKATAAKHASSIGRPIANTQILLLDERMRLVPRGATGELCIAGDGLARGYLNRAELTRERFVDHPFAPGKRIYRTGDLARWLPDKTIAYFGRVDQQVKIRGFRVELEEIEAAIEGLPQIRQAVVVLREFGPGDRRLVAYVSLRGKDGIQASKIRQHLAGTLPEYMLPAVVLTLPAIPLTPHGKVDRRALALREMDCAKPDEEFEQPSNHVERVMAEIWSEVLGVEKIGVHDGFFELGGHSLAATRLITRLRCAFGIDLPLRSLFLEPTIAGLAKHIRYDAKTRNYRHVGETPLWKCLVPAQPRGTRTPFFFVAGFQNPDDTLMVLSRFFPYMGADQPVFGFRPRWVDGTEDGYSSLEEVALEFLAELRTVQPTGPYLLGGHCVGGIIAVRIADQLRREGEEVRLLALLDTERPTALRSFVNDCHLRWLRGKHICSVICQIIRPGEESRRSLLAHLVRRKLRIASAESPSDSEADRFQALKIGHRRLMHRTRLDAYPGRITLFVNEVRHRFDRDLGWKKLAKGGLHIHKLPGDHEGTLPLYGQEFARLLLQCIDESMGDINQPAEPAGVDVS